ncbi:uncharacterized protein LACBIDRAFT_243354 [Laccaria bicolor S238N-H82]|uniref:Predicted protein n=1 Tax=Laccaria bicolor (strain S238N-H82 / ATCC MYA-4686) TaxID=486041 RepID=B0CRB1_LACBS|nr:uncharacterized protein LACBIDRAFT_243354 [Laccaria bicolor S238N-H82]EDR15172.1 predicted protein [Laccaria bicolor S238N-H82]|eukprot:XP_001873380.1 predicted protein [Laccaria bicolor S238N-H82]
MAAGKVVICGAGFIGSHIARSLIASQRPVQISSRNPAKTHELLEFTTPKGPLLPAVSVDVTKPTTLIHAFKDAGTIISLVGVMHGTPKDFEDVQWKGAENVALAARAVGAKVIHFSAIGANTKSEIMYFKTKAMGENSVLDICPDATIIRPSLVFGPEDDFFNRFARLSRVLPFLPVFGGGKSRFQPVYVGDLSKAVEILCRGTPEIKKETSGKIIEAGGPEVFTYHQLMELVLKYSGRHRPIISFPFPFGLLQGAILENLPPNLFTVTRAQVKQLMVDNVVNIRPRANEISFQNLLEKYSNEPLTSVHKILPTYL